MYVARWTPEVVKLNHLLNFGMCIPIAIAMFTHTGPIITKTICI